MACAPAEKLQFWLRAYVGRLWHVGGLGAAAPACNVCCSTLEQQAQQQQHAMFVCISLEQLQQHAMYVACVACFGYVVLCVGYVCVCAVVGCICVNSCELVV